MLSHEIGKMVYDTVYKYTKLQNKTKMLYFNYLSRNKSVSDFSKQVDKLWRDLDHSFMDKQIDKLQETVHDENVKLAVAFHKVKKEADTKFKKADTTYYKIVPESEFRKVENKFADRVVSNYKKSSISKDKLDSDTYLEKKLESYDSEVNKVVAYYNKNNEVVRHVDVSTYLSMLHNTNLTRSAWDQTMVDADKLGAQYFMIPTHPFSCEDCAEFQGIALSRDEVEEYFGLGAEDQVGELLHPNCKCTLSILWDPSQLESSQKYNEKYDLEEQEEMYEIRQKVNGLSLMIERNQNDIDIARMLGNNGLVDELNNKNAILEKKEKELVNRLPTNSLKKQVEAVNR